MSNYWPLKCFEWTIIFPQFNWTINFDKFTLVHTFYASGLSQVGNIKPCWFMWVLTPSTESTFWKHPWFIAHADEWKQLTIDYAVHVCKCVESCRWNVIRWSISVLCYDKYITLSTRDWKNGPKLSNIFPFCHCRLSPVEAYYRFYRKTDRKYYHIWTLQRQHCLVWLRVYLFAMM